MDEQIELSKAKQEAEKDLLIGQLMAQNAQLRLQIINEKLEKLNGK